MKLKQLAELAQTLIDNGASPDALVVLADELDEVAAVFSPAARLGTHVYRPITATLGVIDPPGIMPLDGATPKRTVPCVVIWPRN